LKNPASSRLLLGRAIEHYASRAALDIADLGEKSVAAIVDAKLVHDLADLYLLDSVDVARLSGFGDLSAYNLVEAIGRAKTPPLGRFIYGLGIRHVGAKTASDLAKVFGDIMRLARATLDELLAVDGVGKVVAESILAWFADIDNEKLIEKMIGLGVDPRPETVGGKLDGVHFAITGTLKSMSREVAADRIRHLGGEFQNAVGQSTDYLVAGGKIGASKRAAAAKFGTKIIDEDEFLKLISA
jgi:DNA ligase (NAD+)